MKNKITVKKVIDFVVDVILIMAIIMITDLLMSRVFHTEKIIFEILIYVSLYIIFFGAKAGVKYLCGRAGNNSDEK